MTEKDLKQQPTEDRNSPDALTNEATTLPLANVSNGPRTGSGKAIASRNAIRHGIFSNAALLKSESRSEYESLLEGLREYFKPVGMFEEILVEKLAILIWRYRRLIITEKTEIESGSPLQFDSQDSSILDRFPRYEASIDRAFDRTLTQLERCQRMRLGEPVAAPIKLQIS
jgi:hypothetical protein